MKITLSRIVVVLLVPLLAHAQAYKCKQPNGSFSFQDQPCQSSATGSKLALPATKSAPIGMSAPPIEANKPVILSRPSLRQPRLDEQRDNERRRNEEEAKVQMEKTNAYNKMQRCNYARQQLGVAKEGRPVFRRDNAGTRQYVDDKDRASVISAAEQKVAAECQ